MKNKFLFIFYSVLLFAVTLSRLFYLSADPSSLISSSVIGDEGYWAHNARIDALFGHSFTDDFVEDVMVAPLLSLLLRISFAFFGLGFWQARLVPALFGVGSIWLMWKLLKSAGGMHASAGTVVLASSFLVFSVNRLVMGESVAEFFILLVFYLIIKSRYGLAGVSWGLAVLSKTNAILILPAFIIAALIFPKKIPLPAIIKLLIIGTLVTILSFIFIQIASGNSVLDTYLKLSGTDYIPHDLIRVWMNLKSFIKNPIWWRWGISIVALGAGIGFLNQKKSQISALGAGLVLSQVALISLLSNQGSDHRFIFLFLGLSILFSLQPPKSLKILVAIWLGWQFLLTVNYFSNLSFTLSDASARIGSLSQPGDKIIGFFSHQLVFENQLFPVYWAPGHEKFKGINSNIDEWKPDLLLQMLVVDGRDGQIFTPSSQTDLGLKQEIIDRFEVLPMNDGYQVVANLRRINW